MLISLVLDAYSCFKKVNDLMFDSKIYAYLYAIVTVVNL